MKIEEKNIDVFNTFAYPGHFYSPFPNLQEIEENAERIFSMDKHVYGIDFNDKCQEEYLEAIQQNYSDLPFSAHKKEGLRYYYENSAYSYGDAITLYSMLRHIQPKKVIEVGCGFSSCVTLDTNELFFDNKIETTFIEPYPELLNGLIKEEDYARVKVIGKRLQEVPLEIFKELNRDDILFIDSTHVAKIDSDVNYILGTILPNIKEGVYIHFHDIFYPFEYPKEWIYGGRAWNEAYMLKSFLQFNDTFEIVLFTTYLQYKNMPYFAENMPLFLKNGGGNIWLRKNK